MNKGVCLNQRNRIILRLVGGLLAVAACCTMLVATPNNEKISVAAASAARSKAVAHMQLMGLTRWIPSQTWYIDSGTKKQEDQTKKIDDYIKGKIYKGMPYSQIGQNIWSEMNSKFTSLYLYVPVNTIKNIYNCQVTTSSAQSFGNDCAKAVFQSWQKAGSSTPITGVNTDSMLAAVIKPQNSMTKVGDYSVSEGQDTLGMTNSASEKVKVQAAYSLLQPGDALVQDYGTKGHAIMVRSVSPGSKKVYTIEQIGSGSYQSSTGKPSGWRLDTTYSTWIVTSYSYDTLYNNHYVPLTTVFTGW